MPNTQTATQGSPAPAARPNGAELREQIKQSILAAQDAAREAAVEGAGRGARTIRVTDGQSDNIYGGQGPTRIVSPSRKLDEAILWPLMRRYWESGEASAL